MSNNLTLYIIYLWTLSIFNNNEWLRNLKAFQRRSLETRGYRRVFLITRPKRSSKRLIAEITTSAIKFLLRNNTERTQPQSMAHMYSFGLQKYV